MILPIKSSTTDFSFLKFVQSGFQIIQGTA
jgi:hypothetical protein